MIARLDASLPLELRPVSAAQKRQVRAATQSGVEQVMPPAMHGQAETIDALAQRISSLEQKIDALVGLLAEQRRRDARDHEVLVELGAEGLCAHLDDPLDVGSSFDLELTLSFVPPRTVRSLAKVVACSALAEGGYAVELSFDAISEQARDELHRYMLTTERLRRRRPTLG